MGTVRVIRDERGNRVLAIEASAIAFELMLGESVAVDGACLTVTAVKGTQFQVEATGSTLTMTNLTDLVVGNRVNLERALRVGDRLGGHIVQGHIDALGRLTRIKYLAGSTEWEIETAPKTLQLIAPQGSITVQGVSLTVSRKTSRSFGVMLIPHTLEHTTLGDLKPGHRLNLETDMILRWLNDRLYANDDKRSSVDFGGEFKVED